MGVDPSQLRTELDTDPQALGYAAFTAVADDIGCAALVNAKTFDGVRSMSSTELVAWAAENGRFVKVTLAATMPLPASNDPGYVNAVGLESIAMAAQVMLNRDNTSLDLNLPDRRQMIAVLVGAGVLTQPDSDSLYALAATKVSRAEQLFGVGTLVTAEQIGGAR